MEEFIVTFAIPYSILGLSCLCVKVKLYGTALFMFGCFLSMLTYIIAS